MRDEAITKLQQFARLVEYLCPRHRERRQPCSLEPDAPRMVKLFWEIVGWSDVVGGGSFGPQTLRPERAASMDCLREAFEVWFENAEVRDAWGVDIGDFSAAWKRLPARFRVIASLGSTFYLSDETGPSEDPPLLELNVAQARLTPLPMHFLDQLIRATLHRVMQHRSTRGDGLPPRGEQILAPLFPGLWQLADGVWGIDGGPQVPEQQRGIQALFHDSFEHYIRFVLAQPDETLACCGIPQGQIFRLRPTPRLDPSSLEAPGFRRFEHREKASGMRWQHAVGYIEDMGIWVRRNMRSRTLLLGVAPEHFDSMSAWIQRNGLELEEPAEKKPVDLWPARDAP